MTEKSALVLFSGGQDSTICLAYALRKFDRVETIGFSYGQRHNVERFHAETQGAEIALMGRHLQIINILALAAPVDSRDFRPVARTRDTPFIIAPGLRNRPCDRLRLRDVHIRPFEVLCHSSHHFVAGPIQDDEKHPVNAQAGMQSYDAKFR